jgi:hypothetical protein
VAAGLGGERELFVLGEEREERVGQAVGVPGVSGLLAEASGGLFVLGRGERPQQQVHLGAEARGERRRALDQLADPQRLDGALALDAAAWSSSG